MPASPADGRWSPTLSTGMRRPGFRWTTSARSRTAHKAQTPAPGARSRPRGGQRPRPRRILRSGAQHDRPAVQAELALRLGQAMGIPGDVVEAVHDPQWSARRRHQPIWVALVAGHSGSVPTVSEAAGPSPGTRFSPVEPEFLGPGHDRERTPPGQTASTGRADATIPTSNRADQASADRSRRSGCSIHARLGGMNAIFPVVRAMSSMPRSHNRWRSGSLVHPEVIRSANGPMPPAPPGGGRGRGA